MIPVAKYKDFPCWCYDCDLIHYRHYCMTFDIIFSRPGENPGALAFLFETINSFSDLAYSTVSLTRKRKPMYDIRVPV
jgi:hypothetical protein